MYLGLNRSFLLEACVGDRVGSYRRRYFVRERKIWGDTTIDPITVTLTASFPTSGKFFSDTTSDTPITTISIENPGGTAKFYFKDSVIGTNTLTISTQNYLSDQTQFTIDTNSPTTPINPAPNPTNNPTTTPTPTPTPTLTPTCTYGFEGSQQTWDKGWDDWTNPPWYLSSSVAHS